MVLLRIYFSLPNVQAQPHPKGVGYRAWLVLLLVVISQLHNFNDPAINAINQSMLIRDAPRPETGQSMLEWFWFANPVVVTSGDILKQLVDSSDELLIDLLPVKIVFPSLRREQKVHAASRVLKVRFVPFPASKLSMAEISLLAFAGERRRYAVS